MFLIVTHAKCADGFTAAKLFEKQKCLCVILIAVPRVTFLLEQIKMQTELE
jgi:hypothetical protein